MKREKLKILDLFSGIGGFSLGLERTGGFETVAFCEIDKYCQKVLKKHWPKVPIFNDVRNLDYDGPVDIITGGYPCQPFSVAGERKGAEDDRHLWPAMFSLIKKHRPTWVIGENVAGHISMGLDSVLADLESEGYGTRVFIIPAVSVAAKHRRDRLWIVGNALCNGKRKTARQRDMGRDVLAPRGREQDKQHISPSSENVCNSSVKGLQDRGSSQVGEQGKKQEFKRPNSNVSDTDSTRREKLHVATQSERAGFNPRRITETGFIWKAEPAVGRVANGVPRRVDRLKCLGNAVVPQIPEMIGNAILESIKNETLRN